MDLMPIFTSVLALVLVLGLIGLISILLRKYGTERMMVTKASCEKRLHVKEVRGIDPKHKLVLVARDNIEHLLVVGVNGVVVVESKISPPNAVTKKGKCEDA